MFNIYKSFVVIVKEGLYLWPKLAEEKVIDCSFWEVSGQSD